MRIQSIQIGITDFCNLRCVHCGQNASEGYGHPNNMGPAEFRAGKLGFMKISLYEKILHDFIDDNIEFDVFNFYWFGETLLHPRFREFFKMTFKYRCFDKFWLYTNGVLLDIETLRFILNNSKGFDRLYFSLDAGDEESFKTIKRTDDFNRVVENFKNAIRIKKEMGLEKPQLVLGLIVLPENVDSLELIISDIMNFAKDIGLKFHLVCDSPHPQEDCIYIRVAYLPEQSKFEKVYQNFLKKIGLLEEVPEGEVEILRKTNMLMIDKETLKPEVKIRPACPAPFRMVTVNWDGRLAICCSDYELEVKLPSLEDMSFLKAWNSREYFEIRKAHLTGEFGIIPRCEHCGGIDALPLEKEDIERLGEEYMDLFDKYKRRLNNV